MNEHVCGLQVAQECAGVQARDIRSGERAISASISLAALKAAKKWTVLFFYPADFTFV